jgi:hypothetical protein
VKPKTDDGELARHRNSAAYALVFGVVAIAGARLGSGWLLAQLQRDPALFDRFPRLFGNLDLFGLALLAVAFLVQAGTALDLARALRVRQPWLWACGAFLGFVGWIVLGTLLVRAKSALDARAPPDARG